MMIFFSVIPCSPKNKKNILIGKFSYPSYIHTYITFVYAQICSVAIKANISEIEENKELRENNNNK